MKHAYLVILLFCSLGVLAQINTVAQNYINKGEDEFKKGNYETAAINFKAAVTNLKDNRVPLRDYAPYEKREEEANQLANLKKNADNLFLNAKSITDYENAKKSYSEIIAKNKSDNNARNRMNECDAKISQIKENNAWNTALTTNSKDAFEKYLNQFPNGAHAKDAKVKIEEIIKAQQTAEEKNYWNSALTKNTVEAFEDYQKKYPNGLYTSESKAKINERKLVLQNEQDEKLWEKATRLNTPEGYFAYLDESDNGKYVSAAKTKITELRDSALWEEAKQINTLDSYTDYLSNENNITKKYTNEANVLLTEANAQQEFENGNYQKAKQYLLEIKKKQNLSKTQQKLFDDCSEEIAYADFKAKPNETDAKIFIKLYPKSKYYDEVKKSYDEMIRSKTVQRTTYQPGRSGIKTSNSDIVSWTFGGNAEFLEVLAYAITTGVKIGSINNPVNFSLEGGYRHVTPYTDQNNKAGEGITLNQVVGSAFLKFNLGGNRNYSDKFVFGLGGEYNYTFNSFYQVDEGYTKENDINIRNEHSLSGIALVGWGLKNASVNFYYKYNILSPYNTDYIHENLSMYENLTNQVNNKSQVGISISFYINK